MVESIAKQAALDAVSDQLSKPRSKLRVAIKRQVTTETNDNLAVAIDNGKKKRRKRTFPEAFSEAVDKAVDKAVSVAVQKAVDRAVGKAVDKAVGSLMGRVEELEDNLPLQSNPPLPQPTQYTTPTQPPPGYRFETHSVRNYTADELRELGVIKTPPAHA